MNINSKVKLGIYVTGLMHEKLLAIMKYCKDSLNPNSAPRICGNVPDKVYYTAKRFDANPLIDGEMFMEGRYNFLGNMRFAGYWEIANDDSELKSNLADCCYAICCTALAVRKDRYGIDRGSFSRTNNDVFAIYTLHSQLSTPKEVKLSVRDAKFIYDFLKKEPSIVEKYGEEYYNSMVGFPYSPFVIASIESLNREIHKAEDAEREEYEILLKEFNDKVDASRKRKSEKIQSLNAKIKLIKSKANNQKERTKV